MKFTRIFPMLAAAVMAGWGPAAWAFKAETEDTAKPGQGQAAPASITCEQPEVQGNAFRAFKALCGRITACNFNFIHSVPAAVAPKSITFHLAEKWNNLTEVTLGYDDFRDLRLDGSEVRFNSIAVVVKTADASQAKGQKLVFGFHYGSPGDFYATQAGAESAAGRFMQAWNVLIDGPGSRVDAYEAKYQSALQACRDAGGKMGLPEAAHRYFVQAEGAFNEKNYGHSIDLYYQGLLAAPWFPRGHFNLAILLAEQEQDYAQVVNEMKKYLELSPGAPDARDAQDKIYLWEDKAPAPPALAPSGQKEDDLQQKILLKEQLAKQRTDEKAAGMNQSKWFLGLMAVVIWGIAGIARPGDALPSPAHPLVIEDWFGKEGSYYLDATGTTASVTFLDRSGERWVKLTYNIVSGGYAGYWQSLSPENVADLSKARSLKLKFKNSYPADGGLCMNDANHVNYVIGFKCTTDIKEMLVPFSAFFKNPGYTPPGAVLGHPMDWSQASYVWIGINTPGKGEFTAGPVMASAAIPYEEKYKEALGDYRDSGGKLTLPGEAKKYFDQGLAASKKHHAFEAEDLYYKSILLAPWYAGPHFPLAVLLAEKEKEYPGAIAEMKKFIELAPDSPQEASAEQDIQSWENMK